jgi:hypothetical protein
MIYLVLLTLLLPTHSQTTPLHIAIQNTSETYFTYLPLTPCPLPASSSLQPGTIYYTLLDPPTIFRGLQLTNSLSFWEVVRNGVSILVD